MYKVLNKNNKDELVSLVVSRHNDLREWTIKYTSHQWIKAKVGKIFVCRTLSEAIKCLDREEGFEIWRCQTKNAKKIQYAAVLDSSNFFEFWNNKKFARCMYIVSAYITNEIKLTKKVWPK